MTQGDAAVKLGVSKSLISMIETGDRVPGYEICGRIARMLGADAVELYAQARKEKS